MSRNERAGLQEHAGQKKEVKQRRKPDERTRRTHQRLGSALVDLIQEKPFDDVTVQEVLDRAWVGPSTFYHHFRDKNDLLLSQLEKFLEMMSTTLSIRKEKSHRVVPVAEMFAHIGGQNKLYRALADSMISSISRKATSAAGLSSASGNPGAFPKFHSVNWVPAPLLWRQLAVAAAMVA